ncbi:hypothetical protein BGZ98_008661 [Dissophora globulifera]|nr:hypothetical protein BGZ98_008661 [Dissophora globulifera]
MKRSKDRESAQQYHDLYHHDLSIIIKDRDTPEAVVTHVRELQEAKNLRCFKNGYNALALKDAEDEAVTSLAKGQYTLTSKVGANMQNREPSDLFADEDAINRPKLTKKRARSIDSDASDGKEDNDPIERLLTSHHRLMGSVIKTVDEVFVATEDELEVGSKFTAYYMKCRESTFKAKYPQDALALNATLLLTGSPTPLQEECFGIEFLKTLQSKMKSRLASVDAKQERSLIREWADCLIDSEWNREQVLKNLEDEEVSPDLKPLKRYLIHAVSEFERVQSNDYREADGVAAFVLPLLRKFFHVPGMARLGYTNCASTASIYHRGLLNFETKTCGQPDLTTRAHHGIELLHGEASGVLCKDANALDQVDDLFDTQTVITQLHIVGRKATMYMQFALGTMYIMMETGTFRIPDSLETLVDLAQDISCLLMGRAVFHRELKMLATKRVQTGASKKHFPSIVTPHAKSALL